MSKYLMSKEDSKSAFEGGALLSTFKQFEGGYDEFNGDELFVRKTKAISNDSRSSIKEKILSVLKRGLSKKIELEVLRYIVKNNNANDIGEINEDLLDIKRDSKGYKVLITEAYDNGGTKDRLGFLYRINDIIFKLGGVTALPSSNDNYLDLEIEFKVKIPERSLVYLNKGN